MVKVGIGLNGLSGVEVEEMGSPTYFMRQNRLWYINSCPAMHVIHVDLTKRSLVH